MVPEKGSCPDKHAHEVLPAINPVNEAIEPETKRPLTGGADESCRIRPELLERDLDVPAGGDHVTKGEARSDEPHDFLVLLARVAVHETNWIVVASRHGIEVGE